MRKANEEGYDVILLACFSDPFLDAAKEISDIPVIGIEEATLHVAAMLGHKFSITTAFSNRVPTGELHARILGLEGSYASTLVMNMSVLDMDANPEGAKTRIQELARKAVQEDGAEVIVLGCAGLAGYAEDIERELGVVVLDPTSVAFKIAEAIADMHIALRIGDNDTISASLEELLDNVRVTLHPSVKLGPGPEVTLHLPCRTLAHLLAGVGRNVAGDQEHQPHWAFSLPQTQHLLDFLQRVLGAKAPHALALEGP